MKRSRFERHVWRDHSFWRQMAFFGLLYPSVPFAPAVVASVFLAIAAGTVDTVVDVVRRDRRDRQRADRLLAAKAAARAQLPDPRHRRLP